jgi:hypothetical protein
VISRGVLLAGMSVLLSGCGTATPGPDQVKRAWSAALESPACPEQHMITADRVWLKFIVSGCGAIEQVQMACDDQRCTRTVISASRLDEPRRLRGTDKAWADPAAAGASAEEVEIKDPTPAPNPTAPKTVVAGRRLTDATALPHKPTLPKEINRAGIVVWGLYKVCVSTEGNVKSVSVIKTALPGGMDAHWIARMENWKYAPYSVDGKAVPFCHPARIEVRSQR